MKRILRMAIVLTILVVAFCQAQVPTRGLVGYWPFDGDANDHSGNGNNGAMINTVVTSDHLGNPGGALHLNGIDAYVRVENSPGLQALTDSITITGWFRVTTWADGLAAFCAKNDAPGTPQFGIVLNSSPDQVSFHFDDGTNNQVLGDYNRDFNLNQWYFIAVTWDGELFRFYIDFSLLDSANASPQIIGNAEPLEFGRDTGGLTDYMNGDLDELRIYNRALSNAEIHQIYAQDATPSVPQHFTGSGHWYQLFPNSVCWNAARDSAVAKGGHLATIADAAEEDFVRSLLLPVPMAAWLGGYDPNGDGTWQWVTGETFYAGGQCQMYCDWAPGEPNHMGTEDRLTIVADPPAHPSYWNNVANCGVPQSFPLVVEWNSNPNPDTLRIGNPTCLQSLLPTQQAIPVYLDNQDTVMAIDIPLLYDWASDSISVSFVGTRLEGRSNLIAERDTATNTFHVGWYDNTGLPVNGLMPVDVGSENIPICKIVVSVPYACLEDHLSILDTTTIARDLGPIGLEVTGTDAVARVPVMVKDSTRVRHFLQGDANWDQRVSISDAVFLIKHIFAGGAAPVCFVAGDADGNGMLSISDVVKIINYIFGGGPTPGANQLCSFVGPFFKAQPASTDLDAVESVGSELKSITITANTDAELQGVQLSFATSGDVRNITVTGTDPRLQVFDGLVDNEYRVGLADLDGVTTLPAGKHQLLTVSYSGAGELTLREAILVDSDAEEMATTLHTTKSAGVIPTEFTLSQNQPNPFNPFTEISFSMPTAGNVKLSVYNILGEEVATLIDEARPAGTHAVTWKGTDNLGRPVASGVYLYRLTTAGFTDTKKMLLLK